MARPASAAMIKRSTGCYRNHRGGIKELQRAPRPGTRLRAFYDLLMEGKGTVVSARDVFFGDRLRAESYRRQLEDFYGLDIRRIAMHYGHDYLLRYILVGEYEGRAYIDYMTDRSFGEVLAVHRALDAAIAHAS